MATSHTWFATKNDAEQVIAWLREAGASQASGDPLEGHWEPDGREVALHFPSIGPLIYWPSTIELSEFDENSPRWRRAVLTQLEQEQSPETPQVDVDKSAVAGLRLPQWRDDRYWVAGHVWFPTSRLKSVFPELGRINGRFERFLRKQQLVFDNRKGGDNCGFPRQVCDSGVLQAIYAFPEAFELLQQGACMVDYLASPRRCADFRIGWERSRDDA